MSRYMYVLLLVTVFAQGVCFAEHKKLNVPNSNSSIEIKKGAQSCLGSFLTGKEGEAEPVLTLASCLDNFYSGGVEVTSRRGEIIRSQDVSVHPSLLESKVSDPAKISPEMNLAVVFFPAGTRGSLGATENRIARDFPSESTEAPVLGAQSTLKTIVRPIQAGTPLFDQAGELVGLSAGCNLAEQAQGETCPAVSLFTDSSRQILLQATSADKYAMSEVALPDRSHEVCLFSRSRSRCCQPVTHCQPQCPAPAQPRPVYYYSPERQQVYRQPVVLAANQNANTNTNTNSNTNTSNSNSSSTSSNSNAIEVSPRINNSSNSQSNPRVEVNPTFDGSNRNTNNPTITQNPVIHNNPHITIHVDGKQQRDADYGTAVRSQIEMQSRLEQHAREAQLNVLKMEAAQLRRLQQEQALRAETEARRQREVAQHQIEMRRLNSELEALRKQVSPEPNSKTEGTPKLNGVNQNSAPSSEEATSGLPERYNGMYDTAQSMPARLVSGDRQSAARTGKQLDGISGREANLMASFQPPLLRTESSMQFAGNLTLIAMGEKPNSVPGGKIGSPQKIRDVLVAGGK